jgi:predicted GTPase
MSSHVYQSPAINFSNSNSNLNSNSNGEYEPYWVHEFKAGKEKAKTFQYSPPAVASSTNNYEAEIITINNIEYLHIILNHAAFKYSDCRRHIENRLKYRSTKLTTNFVVRTESLFYEKLSEKQYTLTTGVKTSLSMNELEKYMNNAEKKLNSNRNNSNNVNLIFEEEEDKNEENLIFWKEEKKSIIPKENINICFVGGVSTGKSTILNAIFCEQLTQCKIKRTTMVPTVYIENNNDSNPFNKDEQTEEIFKTISKKNQEIIELTENGHKLKKEEYQELAFNVGKLDINILPDSFVNVYDIPGLNDARTKDVYYEYLDENFYKFNLVIFLVDIHSGLNTSDEMEIVNFIANRTKEQLENNNRKIYTLVVVNKADDMRLDEDSNETDKLELTGELSEMYDQVEKTITDKFKRKNVSEQLIGIIPLCAIDAYLYRMVKKHGSNFKLSPEQILKIGVNEHGKRFSTLKPATQEKKVYEILGDKAFIETMIKLSGFSCFEKILAKFLNENDTGKQIRIDNLLYDLRKIPTLTSIAKTDSTKWFNMLVFENTVKKFCEIYESIKIIDVNIYNENIINMVEEIDKLLQEKVNKWFGTKSNLITAFDNFVDTIIKRYLSSYANASEYPSYFTNKIISLIENQYDSMQVLTIEDIAKNFELIKQINVYNKEIVAKLLNKIILNSRGDKSINFEVTNSSQTLINLLIDLTSINVDATKFIRFCIINQLYSMRYSHEIRAIKSMLYQKYDEIPISNLLKNEYNYMYANVPINVFVDGITPDVMSMPELELDIYYLNYTA